MHAPAIRPSLAADLRSLPRPFWVLFAGTFINRFGSFVWPFLTIYLTRLGYSLTAASVAVSAVGAGALLGGILGGWLADHFGRRNTIVLGTFGAASSVMLLYSAHSLPAIVAAAAMIGICAGTYHPAASALVVDIVPQEQRVRAFAALRLAANAGFACGTAAGGVLVNYSLFWLFAGDALTTATYGVIALLWLPHGLRGQTQRAPWSAALVSLRHDRAFHALWLAAFASACIAMQFASTYSLHVMSRGVSLDLGGFHLGPETLYGLLISWNGVLIVLAELPLTSWTLRFDPRRVMALGYVLEGVGFALNGVAYSTFTLAVAMTIFTVGEMISAPTTSAFVARLAPEQLRGRYMGALALAWNSAGIAGPLLGFRLFAYHPNAVWLACAALGVGAAWCILRVRMTSAQSAGL
jgi:MFS family permease